MFELSNLSGAFLDLFAIDSIIAILLGCSIGVVIGALPGCTATMALAVTIPLTFWFPADVSLLLLIAIYNSAIFGGSISAIILNIPGTPASAATCWDGNYLARRGQGGKALTVAIISSVYGGLLSGFALLFFAPALASLALKFGPLESALIALFGMTMVSLLASDNLAKGLLMAAFGMFLGCFGADPGTGAARLTFGFLHLYSGFSLTPLLVGVFSIPEVIKMFKGTGWSHFDWDPKSSFKVTWKEIKSLKKSISIGSLIGIIIGLIPAVGPETATFVAYAQAKKVSDKPDLFGKGSLEGISASESANNAVVGSSLAPMFALGIPGSGAAMVLMGGLMIHGLAPGPKLFLDEQMMMMTCFMGDILAVVVMLGVGLIAAKLAPVILKVPHYFLGPIILVISMAGAFAVNNSMFDLGVMVISGIFAYFLNEAGFSSSPLVLGLMLGPMFETYMTRAITISAKNGFLQYVLHRPIAISIVVVIMITMFLPRLLRFFPINSR